MEVLYLCIFPLIVESKVKNSAWRCWKLPKNAVEFRGIIKVVLSWILIYLNMSSWSSTNKNIWCFSCFSLSSSPEHQSKVDRLSDSHTHFHYFAWSSVCGWNISLQSDTQSAWISGFKSADFNPPSARLAQCVEVTPAKESSGEAGQRSVNLKFDCRGVKDECEFVLSLWFLWSLVSQKFLIICTLTSYLTFLAYYVMILLHLLTFYYTLNTCYWLVLRLVKLLGSVKPFKTVWCWKIKCSDSIKNQKHLIVCVQT